VNTDFEILIITCRKDWELTVRLVDSIQTQFKDELLLHRINIVWNEPREEVESKLFRKMNKRIAQLHRRAWCIRYLTEHHIDPRLGRTLPGSWYSQQYLKLKACEQIDATWYLVLDSKDYWIKPVDVKRLFHSDGRARLWTETLQEQEIKGLLNSTRSKSPHLEQLDSTISFGYAWLCTRAMWQHHMNDEDRERMYTRCTTPYMFHTQSAREMNHELETVLGGFYPFMFHTLCDHLVQPIATEFHLYSNYINSRNRTHQVYDCITPTSDHYDDEVPWAAVAKNRTLDPATAEVPKFNRKPLRHQPPF